MIITAIVFVLYVIMPSVIGSKKHNKGHHLGKNRSYEAWDRSRELHRLSH